MAQLDALIIFPLIWSLILILCIYYQFSINIFIPHFARVGKIGGKKLNSLDQFGSFNSNVTLQYFRLF